VTSWTDQTGNTTLTQGTVLAKPNYISNDSNGEPALRFGGSQSLTNTQALEAGVNKDMTIITVGMTTALANQQYSLYLGNGTTGGTRALGYKNSAEFYDTTGSTAAGIVTPAAGIFVAEAASLNPALSTVTFYRNGTQTATGALTGLLNVNGGISVGNFSYSGWKGDISEVLVYDHQLSSAELQQVSLYLANKYGTYYSGASWISSYSTAVQTQINANQWSKAQADAYNQILQTLPVANGLTAWYRADSGMHQNADTQAVESWQDSGLNHYDLSQATSANQPLLSADSKTGRPVVKFNGSQWLSNNANTLANDVTIFSVASTPVPSGSGGQVCLGSITAPRGFAYDSGKQAFNNAFAAFVDGGAASSSTSLTESTMTYSQSGSSVSFFSNGTSNGTVAATASSTAAGNFV
jgi:hypothetical protein